MSIIASPAQSVKPAKPRRPFGEGITTAESLQSDADAAIAAGTASRRPTVEGRGLNAAEHDRMNGATNTARRTVEADDALDVEAVGAAVRDARSRAFGRIMADRPIAIARGFTTRAGHYVPSVDEETWLSIEAARWDADAALDHEAREAAWLDLHERGLAC